MRNDIRLEIIPSFRYYTSIIKKSYSRISVILPLKAGLVEADYPVWDGGGLTSDEEDAFLKLENDGDIPDYYDVTSHIYGHKFGGYPSFCQSGVDLDPYEFVFQISSDPKIRVNVIDGGSLTFWRHPETGDWKLYYDFC